MSVPSNRENIRFLWSRLRPHRHWVFLSIFFAVFLASIEGASNELLKLLQDKGFVARDWTKVLFYCRMLVVIFFFDGVMDFCHRFCLRIGTERAIRTLRAEVFERFLVMSPARLARYNSSTAVNHVVSDVHVVAGGMPVLADLIHDPLVLIALLVYLFVTNWKLSLFCLIAVPAAAIVSKRLGASAKRNRARIQASMEDITNHVIESMGGLRTAQSFNQTGRLRAEFQQLLDHTYRFLIRLARTEELVNPSMKWTMSLLGALLFGFAGWLIVRENISTGTILALLMAAGRLQQPLRQLTNVNVRMQQVFAASERLQRLLDEPLDALSQDQMRTLTLASPSATTQPAPLHFDNVSFRYPERLGGDARTWKLERFSLHLEPGRRLALVGKSGSGKSTVALLALRFLDPSEGRVSLGGRDVRQWQLENYRAHFGWVSQDVFLFNRSLRENLQLARPGAGDSEILAALDKAHIRDFAQGLPQGLDTVLGERASTLSGGERQRLAIARAFLRDAPLIILDEATSQLDAHSEKAVQSALDGLMKGRSVLVIAHRLSTVRNADEVLVMDEGCVSERGSPAQLLQNVDGAFARLWKSQIDGALKT